MDATLAGLLHGCAAAPDDSTPHLILADWLDDHGQPERAELVRLQCRLADWVPDWQQRQEPIARQDELIAEHRDRWLGPLAGHCQRVEFVRGLCRVTVRGQRFCTRPFGQALTEMASTALVGNVRVLGKVDPARLATRPWLELVPGLVLAGLKIDAAALGPLLTTPAAGRLADLDLSHNDLGPFAEYRLLQSPLARNLGRLALRHNNVPAATLLALLEFAPPGLREIDLACNDPTPEVLREADAWHADRGTRRDRLVNSLGMEFVRVPAGSFLMGPGDGERDAHQDEQPRHPVTLTRPFYLARFATTQAEYRACVGAHSSHFPGPWSPVDSVGPAQALAFCRWLESQPAERAAGRTYRLPTEAEWEHACRAGTFTAFHFGDEPALDLLNFQGRWEANERRVRHPQRTLPVGSYPPNAFGLCDMHGNLWEPVADWYAADWYSRSPAVDPTGPESGTMHGRRGGCWGAIGSYCRAAKRHGAGPEETGLYYHGFRIVLVPA